MPYYIPTFLNRRTGSIPSSLFLDGGDGGDWVDRFVDFNVLYS